MRTLRAVLRAPGSVVVRSLNVQAAMVPDERVRTQFEVMVRHLFDRMLNNEAFGEDAATRVTQLAYALALPGVLVAMFLLAAYHHPPPLHLERSMWQQACDHLFYVTYSLVVLGTAVLFQWEMLFPDLLDVYVLTSLPIPSRRLLLGRVTALAIFLAMVQVGTSGLGALFFPAAADLKCGFWRHFVAHAAGVNLAAIFAVAFFVALHGLLVCLPTRVAAKASTLVKVVSMIALLGVLFLFPLVAHSIEKLVALPSGAALWYPPFWFLGVYESVLEGSGTPAVFQELARRGLLATAGLAVAGALLYPAAYRRRVRQLVEGAGVKPAASSSATVLRYAVHRLLVRTPRARATFHFAMQTLGRLQTLHLYLAMYAGAGIALVLSGLIVFVTEGERVRTAISADGVRMAVPVVAFWSVMALRTALRSPLGLHGSWVFRVVGGTPGTEELHGAEIAARTIATAVTLGCVSVLHLLAPAELRTGLITASQVVIAVGLSLVLTDIAFLPVRSIPFTRVLVRTTRELPLTLILYLMVFPEYVLKVMAHEGWIEASWMHLLKTAVAFGVVHAVLRWVRRRVLRGEQRVDDLLFAGLGLREE